MPDLDFTGVDPADYIDTTWTDQNGKPWRAYPNGMWKEYVEPVTGGSGAWEDITGKPAAVDALSGTNTGDNAVNSLYSGLDAAKAPIATTVTLDGTQTLTNKSISAAQITGLGALATVTPGTNVATALAIAADATGGIFRQGQALSGATGTFSGAVSVISGTPAATSIRHPSAAGTGLYFPFSSQIAFAISGSQTLVHGSGYVQIPSNAAATTFLLGSSGDVAFSRISPGVAGIAASFAGGSGGSLNLTNLTASGTVSAAQYLYTSALFVTESTAARTLTSADHGKTIVCTHASAVTITLDTGLPTCFFVTIIQKGAGQVTVSGSATLEVFAGFAAKTAGQHAQMSVSNYGTSNVYHVAGQLGT